jgi:hypothetical protein
MTATPLQRSMRGVQSRFESDAGKRITILNTGQQWARFDAATMKEAFDSGTDYRGVRTTIGIKRSPALRW